MNLIHFTTEKLTVTNVDMANRFNVEAEANLEYLLQQLPSELIHAELSRRHKAAKMSGVLILEPVPHESDGSPATFEFTTKDEDKWQKKKSWLELMN